ncbi:hypothetical protein SLEP1_g26057 [Rubroshorea leprosula]|uniref:Integrase catalytic domain-containing protein n=1 Tax=Rubroshorea leprosula TaxID=152421 RepID=A0AAV5JRC4_9ROSI|nr:hypothetical protein SLEP1_g26057 [Rubroshorea leprosula]
MVKTRSVRAGNSSQPLGRGQVPSNLPPQPSPPIPNTFPHVDHAEGGDENQPHNSADNSASTANQDVVAIQLAAMQQQFGVFQLVLAQLLARNNPGDPLLNLLNPAPQPPAPQQNPEQVQHAPAISESQGQSHITPVQQPLHDGVTRRLDNLEKLVAEQRGAPPPHPAADSVTHPFNTNITLEPYPAGFRIPQLETYDGTKDPDDHLHAFYSCMQAQNASDALMCKIFPSTLRGNARTWYYSLPPKSISSYTEMTSAFATKFSSRRLIKKTTSELMRVRQRDGEPLKNFMSRFNDAVLEVNSFDQAAGIMAVISGFSHERFRDSLLKHPATTFNENRAQKRKFDDAEWKNQPITFTYVDLDTVVTPHNDPLVTSVTINNCEVQRVLVDKGSAPDIMYNCFESLGLDPALLQRYDGPIYGFNNQPVSVEGVLTMNVAFGSDRSYVTPSVRFLVVKMASSFNVVIGRPTLTKIRAVVFQSHLCKKFPTPTGIATLRGNQEVARHCYITSVTQPQKGKDQTSKTNPKQISNDWQVMGVEIIDNRPEDDTRAAPVEDVEEVQIDDRDPTRKTQIGTWLSPDEKTELIAFLRANKDVFTWTSAAMLGIPTSRLTVIKEEVEKLLQVGFVRRVDYCEWVANPVLVKKANGKWQMCIDYTNLNQACPKDCYPMPNIDKLVEAASGNERLSLLDAYSGYHQVPMAPKDEEKTSFYAGDEIYCYVMMPFGLKNVGATYQKMVTIVFRAQIGRNLEVYVDDIMVKSAKAGDHLTDLKETFNNLRKNRMRLNPAKCIFGVESGKFLGFMVSRRGIEVNPEKIKAVAEMEPPKSMKDIQRLTGRVVALHRFISKLADKCLPFFKIMRAEVSIAEKVALVVVTSARKLRPYFQSHPIIILTDQPLRQILQKPECSGRLIKWAVELEEFEITFQQRSAIRAQALADFIVECTPRHPAPNPKPNEWTLYVDGASSSKGSGAGALLIGPDGYRSEHALKFNFDATNNMAEYEALLLGLQLALELKISAIQPAEELTTLIAPWPFAQWGLDLLGPFMKGIGGVTHLLVCVDYFTKWVEARVLSSLTSRKVEDFVFSSIICRYGIPNQIVADNGTQFNCSSFRDFCSSYGIKLQFTSVYHPESNGMVEFVNKCILEGIKLRLEQHKAKWADELNNVLWAYRTTSRTTTGETPYHLAFGTEAVIPIEIGVPSFRVTHFDEGRNGQLLRENLDLLDKLAPNWEGPYIVAEVPYLGAYVLQGTEGKRVPRVWNANNLKKFYP